MTNPERWIKTSMPEGFDQEYVLDQMRRTMVRGTVPTWEAIEESEPLDLETVWRGADGGDIHQVTVPIPVEEFPKACKLPISYLVDYMYSVCRRENWRRNYSNCLCVLSQLEMEL